MVSPEAGWEGYWRTGASTTEMRNFAYLEMVWPWTGSLGREHYAFLLPHTNPEGGTQTVQDFLANQGLQADLPVRRGGGFFLRVPCRWFRSVAEQF